MWFKLSFLLLLVGLVYLVSCAHPKRNRNIKVDNYDELCMNKGPLEFFRLINKTDCNEVYQCSEFGLLPLRCPAGLVFDVERQTCDWKKNVKNCNQLEKTKIKNSKNLIERSICENGKLGCGSKECINQTLFCDGVINCKDGSDEFESICNLQKDPNRAPVCNKLTCKLPNCFCSENATSIPNDLLPQNVPQMVMITFDDAINNNNIDIYNELFTSNRLNPNGCSIKGTFFLSHKYSNFSAVQDLHRKGHEIAVHSITHNSDEKYWSNGTVKQWTKEMAGARLIIERFANITDNSILGIRAPLLKVGGNNQFKMMKEQGFLWDSSMGAPLSDKPKWPYTLDYLMPQKCYGNFQKCPTRSFKGIWEIIMNEYDRREYPEDEPELTGCLMVDQCTNVVTGDALYNFLNVNFDRHYNSNRAPLGLYFHASWLLNRQFLDSLIEWIDEKLQKKDVYFTTMTQVIRWIQNPTPLASVNKFDPWLNKCKIEGPPACHNPNQCALVTRELPGETIRLHSCMPCSRWYPWFHDPTGDFQPDAEISE